MPIVTIQVTREGTAPGAVSVTPEQKAALIKGASQLLLDVLNKPLDSTFVVIDEVEMENWGWGACPSANIERSSQRVARQAHEARSASDYVAPLTLGVDRRAQVQAQRPLGPPPGGRPGGRPPWERPERDRLAALIPGLKRTPRGQ